jgi:hypothetical protein
MGAKFDFKNETYDVTAEWGANHPAGTVPTDRKGNVLVWIEEAVAIFTLVDTKGNRKQARLSLNGPIAAGLHSVGLFDPKEILAFYFGELPSLMEVDPNATVSWPGILNTPDGKWFCQVFKDYDRVEAFVKMVRTPKP